MRVMNPWRTAFWSLVLAIGCLSTPIPASIVTYLEGAFYVLLLVGILFVGAAVEDRKL